MGKGTEKLSAVFVAKIKAPGYYGDGKGLWLQVAKAGSKSWLYRFMLHGKSREMGLGGLSEVSLAEAREKARESRRFVKEGADPIDARNERRQQTRLDATQEVTFSECAVSYIESHKAGWRNAKHATQWTRTLETYAFPIIGRLPVAEVDTGHVLRILEPVWQTKTETASRVRGRIESVLDWARVRGYRTGDNPARWRGHLDKQLPKRSRVAEVKHFKAMPYEDVPALMAAFKGKTSVSAYCLRFVILTATRSSEARGARWDEIDFTNKVWTVPPERMKAKRPHRVPLSDEVIDLLNAVPRIEGQELVFPGLRGGVMSDVTLSKALHSVRLGFTVHGFRSSFREWAAEQTNFPAAVCELALAHVNKDKVEAAYQRSDLFERRRELMDEWSSHLL